jgi:hypothetical protein
MSLARLQAGFVEPSPAHRGAEDRVDQRVDQPVFVAKSRRSVA